MKFLENEEVLWESKNKNLILTSHRIREVSKNIFGNRIRSIMLEELTYSELGVIRQNKFWRRAILYFLLLNGSIYLLNNYLFEAEIIKFLFDDFHIGQQTASWVFYLSLGISLTFIMLYIFSIKKVFSFYASGMSINFQIRWLDFEEREGFISMVEDAKDKRTKIIKG